MVFSFYKVLLFIKTMSLNIMTKIMRQKEGGVRQMLTGVRGFGEMLTMADKGGGEVGEMLTMADEGERGGVLAPPFFG